MQKMMTYSEANEVLGASLTPLNRCLSKAVAIANDADPDLLVNYTNDRLVPANAIEPGSHWIDEHTIEHYFVDENGNKIGDGKSLSVTIPEHGEFIIVRTKSLLDGLPFPEDLKGGRIAGRDDTPTGLEYAWVPNEGIISKLGIHVHATFDIYADRWPNPSAEQESRDDFGPVDETSKYRLRNPQDDPRTGITTFILHCPLNYGYRDITGNFHFHILMNDWFANPNKMNLPNVVNTWNINMQVNADNLSYDIDRSLINFGDSLIGQQSADTSLEGFGNNPNDYEILYVGYYDYYGWRLIEDEAGKISEIVKNDSGTSFTVIRTGDALGTIATSNIYKIYKKSNPSIHVYFVAYFEKVRQ